MKLVLLFFCILIVLAILIILSSIKINVKKFYVSNIRGKQRKKELDKKFSIYVEFYLLGIIKLAKIRISKKLLNKLNIKTDAKQIEKSAKAIKKIQPLTIIKKLKIKTEKLNLKLDIGTFDVVLTSYIVAVISSILGIIYTVSNPKIKKFEVKSLYNFGNSIKINLNCIINVKIVHIIYVIYILLKIRRKSHERTSNRGAYDYGYE